MYLRYSLEFLMWNLVFFRMCYSAQEQYFKKKRNREREIEFEKFSEALDLCTDAKPMTGDERYKRKVFVSNQKRSWDKRQIMTLNSRILLYILINSELYVCDVRTYRSRKSSFDFLPHGFSEREGNNVVRICNLERFRKFSSVVSRKSNGLPWFLLGYETSFNSIWMQFHREVRGCSLLRMSPHVLSNTKP